VWAGVDKVWEQGKLEARKMLENRADSHTSGAPKMIANDHFIREKQGRKKSILQNGKHVSRTKQWRARKVTPVVHPFGYAQGRLWFPVKLI